MSYRDVWVKMAVATDSLAADLEVPEGHPLVLVHRRVHANRKPVAVMSNYLLAEIVPGIEGKAHRIRSLYAFLESEYNLCIESAAEYISARAAAHDEAVQLGIKVGTPVLVFRRITYARGRPIERVDCQIVASHYEYNVRTARKWP